MVKFVKALGALGNCQAEFKRKGFIWRMYDLGRYRHVTHKCMVSFSYHVMPHICPCTATCITIDSTVKERK